MSATEHKPYPSYKDSGMEWLGEIPAHWDVHRLKEVAAIQMSNVDKKSVEGEEPVELCNYTDVYYNDRITPAIEFMKATAPRDQIRRFALRRGDVLITKDSESWTDIAVPAVVVEDLPHVLCGYHLAHIRPSPRVYGPYLARAIGAIGPRDQFRVAANGVTRFAIGTEAVATSVFAMPPLNEQHTIAAFLDRETARIDALVAKKERLIALLQERRTALITRAVTKGLDPAVPMKDSGVEWLGEIPAHWEVRRLKQLGSMQAGTAITSDSIEVEADYPVFGGNGVRGYTHGYTHEGAFPLIGRQGALCGCVTLATGRFWASEHAIVVRPSAGTDAPWLAEALAAMELNQYSVSAAQPGLAVDNLGVLKTASPPLAEQRAIADFLQRETSQLDELTERIGTAINHLHELRTALISAAVTGKIDVREAAT